MLVVVEIGGNGDDSVGDLLAKILLSSFLHLAENHGRDFLRSKGLLSLTSSLNLDVRFGALLNNLEKKS